MRYGLILALFMMNSCLQAGAPASDLKEPLIDDEVAENGKIDPKEPSVIILSLPGGGTAGAGMAKILEMMHDMLAAKDNRCNLYQHLKKTVIAGTSTGAIVAAWIKNPEPINPDTKRPFDFKSLVKLYLDLSPKIFKPSWRLLNIFREPPFCDKELVKAGAKYFGDHTLGEIPGLVIMTVEEETKQSVRLSSLGRGKKLNLTQAVEHSIAIPYLFPPVHDEDGKNYEDGGTSLNDDDPIQAAFDHLVLQYKNAKKSLPKNVLAIDLGPGPCKGCHLSKTCCTIVDLIMNQGKISALNEARALGVNLEIINLSFPMGNPLASTQHDLHRILKNAEDEVHKDPNIKKAVDLIFASWQHSLNGPAPELDSIKRDLE